MSGAPECRMSAAAVRPFSFYNTARLGLFLCASLFPFASVFAQQTPESDPAPQSSASPTLSAPRSPQGQEAASPPRAQSSEPASEVDTHASVPFQSHVNLVPVRVVVHDSNGKVVTGLTKEDFRLFQDRRPQTISHFSVETPASAAQQVVRGGPSDASPDQPVSTASGNLAMPSRFVALLFDDIHLNLQDLMQARLAALRFLDTSVEPTERVALLTTSGQTQVDFTDDRAKIREMLKQMVPHFIGGFDPSGTSQCPPMNYY